jgi:hypothetical protein
MKKGLFILAVSVLLLSGCQSKESSVAAFSSASKDSLTESSLPESSSSAKVYTEKLTDGEVKAKAYSDQVGIYKAGYDNEAYYTITVSWNWQWTSSLKPVDLSSSDESILPLSAVSYFTSNASTSNNIIGATISIDLKSVKKTGTCFLEASFASGNNSSDKGTICKNIQFVDFGQVKTDTYSETLSLDWTKAKIESGDKVTFQINDDNYVYGLSNPDLAGSSNPYLSFRKIDLSGLSVTKEDIAFKYIVGHTYSLIFMVYTTKGAYHFYDFESTVGEGDSTTGFNQFKYSETEDALTFVKDNSKLTITLLATYHA